MDILSRRGLPGDFRVEVVNTSAPGRKMHAATSFSARELRRNTGILAKLAKALLVFRPDIVHINCSLARTGIVRDWTCAAAAHVGRARVLTHYHGSIAQFVKEPGIHVNLLHRLMVRSQVNIVSNTPDLEYVHRTSPARDGAFYLPNYVDAEQFFPSRPVPNPADRARRQGIYVGALTQQKGALDVVEVARRRPDIDFTLVSASVVDSFKPAMESLPQNVTLRVNLTNDELTQALRESTFFIFLSYHEGFPLAVTEAMCSGLPVIATNVGSVPEMIDEGKGGELCSPGDVDGALAALDRFVAAGRFRDMGEHNRRKALAHFTFDVVGPRLVEIYNALLD
ncbi:MAG: glycosyltransferase family 4 protein [Acidobacteria bacterium]|nr:glycosyltransferase family 4 protein [Acidobacteriota bacterium]